MCIVYKAWLYHCTLRKAVFTDQQLVQTLACKCTLPCDSGHAPLGHRGLRADGQEDGSDAADVRDGAGRDGAAQRRRGHVHPAERSHGEEGQDEGEEEELQHHFIVQDSNLSTVSGFSTESTETHSITFSQN